MVLNHLICNSILLAIRCANLLTYLLTSIEAAVKTVFVWSCRILSVKCLSDFLWIVANRFGPEQQVNFGNGHGARTFHNQLFKIQGDPLLPAKTPNNLSEKAFGICNMSSNSPAFKNFRDNFFLCNYQHARPLFTSENTTAYSVQLLSTADAFLYDGAEYSRCKIEGSNCSTTYIIKCFTLGPTCLS